MRINTNVSALAAARNLGMVQDQLKGSTEKLSSGFRINHASDDAAGLGIANVMRSDIRAFQQASRNAEQAGSLYSIAEGAAISVEKMLERMKELAAQAASDSVDAAGRGRINSEFQALVAEITRTVNTTKFQGVTLLDGTFGQKVDTTNSTAISAGIGVTVASSGSAAGTYTIASAANVVTVTKGGKTQSITIPALTVATYNFDVFGLKISTDSGYAANALNGKNIIILAGSGTFLVGASGDYANTNGGDSLAVDGTKFDLKNGAMDFSAKLVDTLANAQAALIAIDAGLQATNATLGEIGAGQSRINNAADNLKTIVQNFTAAESTIRDVDMADEMVKFSKNQILAQAGTAMLAQANQSAQSVLKLLQ
jgi:flagellin